MNMPQCSVISLTDTKLMALVRCATHRLVIIAPGPSEPVARAQCRLCSTQIVRYFLKLRTSEADTSATGTGPASSIVTVLPSRRTSPRRLRCHVPPFVTRLRTGSEST